jgi:hypothetical protein
MRRSSLSLTWLALCVLVMSTGGDGILNASDEFKTPPAAEREAVAALAKVGARVSVDGDYRVTSISLGTGSTNEQLKHLANCEKLTSLNLSSAQINDEGVEPLKALSKLTTLTISSSRISAEGVDALRKGLPNCRITTLGGSRFGAGGPNPAGGQPGGAPGGRDRTRGTTGGFPSSIPGGFGGSTLRSSRPATLARNASVQDDLKLTPEQRQQISEASTSTALSALMEALDAKVLGVLSDEQKARLKQLELQQLGLNALTREDIVKQLKLSEEQVTSVRKHVDEGSEANRSAVIELLSQRTAGGPISEELNTKAREKSAEIRKQTEEKVMGVLNDEQKKSWQTKVGPKGPELTSTSLFGDRSGPPASPIDPAVAAKTVFERYDADKDGKISDTEFPESNRTRQSMVLAGITLTFPVPREEFEKSYAKYYGDLRARR